MANNDNQNFRRFKQGDHVAFESIFKKYYKPLCYFAMKYLDTAEESEEIVQELFCQLWDKKEAINLNVSLKSYLFRAVHNNCLKYLQHQQVKLKHLKEQQHNMDYDEATEIFQTELFNMIENAVSELPEKTRKIFHLSRTEGLKYNEIAEKLNISVKTVEARMGAALKHFRERLAEYLTVFINIMIFLIG